jgi:hypothetical protein
VRAAAAAVEISVSEKLPIGGWITPRITEGALGPLRAQVLVVTDGRTKLCLGSSDVTYLHRDILDEIGREVEDRFGIPFQGFMFAATHNHTSPIQTDWSDEEADQTWNLAIKKAILEAVAIADGRLARAGETELHFALGHAQVGQNSRLVMEDGSILWVPTIYKFAQNRPTGPYDAQLPVLAFKDAHGKVEALLFNHSTHNIDQPSPVPARSPGFYGLASQEIERELGGTAIFLPGAFGSTHVFDDCPTSERVYRVRRGIEKAYGKAERREVHRLASVKKEIEFTIRTFDEEKEHEAVSDYCRRWLKESTLWQADPEPIIEAFRQGRRRASARQGETRRTWLQVVLLGDVAFVGVPGELFASLGMEIKRRSPFRDTYVVGIANDYVGYLPDEEAFDLGGYQTWAGRAWGERGTGEAIVSEAIAILGDLHEGREAGS